MPLTVGSLFSGIGGIDLGLERAGMVTHWFVEIDPHCRNVLARHWPGLPIYGDITAVDWSGVEPVDVLAGGFPCQPISSAGKQLAQADDRWLWPEFSRAIRALRPRYVLVENVRNLLAVNGGSAMGEVVGGLAALGYDAEWDCIPAAAVGAPHLRERLWIVAHPAWVQPRRTEQWSQRQRTRPSGESVALADADRGGQQERSQLDGGAPQDPTDWGTRRPHVDRRRVAMAHPSSRGRDDGRIAAGPGRHFGGWSQEPARGRRVFDREPFGHWLPEPDVGRVANGVPHRVDRLRSLGNAVVPQVVEWIGRRIVAFDEGKELAA